MIALFTAKWFPYFSPYKLSPIVRLRLAFPLCLMQRNGAFTGPEFGCEEVELSLVAMAEVWGSSCTGWVRVAAPPTQESQPIHHSVVLHWLHAIIPTLQSLNYSALCCSRDNSDAHYILAQLQKIKDCQNWDAFSVSYNIICRPVKMWGPLKIWRVIISGRAESGGHGDHSQVLQVLVRGCRTGDI